MSEPTDRELCARVRAGKEASEALVKRHYAAACHFARKINAPPGVDLDDLIQEALMGIARAAELWEEGKGTKFITYASWAMRNRIIRFLTDHRRMPLAGRATNEDDQASPVPLPVDITPYLNTLNHTARTIVVRYFGLEGNPESYSQIAARLGLSVPQVKATLDESIQALRLVARPET